MKFGKNARVPMLKFFYLFLNRTIVAGPSKEMSVMNIRIFFFFFKKPTETIFKGFLAPPPRIKS